MLQQSEAFEQPGSSLPLTIMEEKQQYYLTQMNEDVENYVYLGNM